MIPLYVAFISQKLNICKKKINCLRILFLNEVINNSACLNTSSTTPKFPLLTRFYFHNFFSISPISAIYPLSNYGIPSVIFGNRFGEMLILSRAQTIASNLWKWGWGSNWWWRCIWKWGWQRLFMLIFDDFKISK